jgi:DHA1 family inner membrane transport protein
VARVFNGFALATVLGLPLGTVVGQAAGWPVTFGLVAVLCVVGLAGVLRYCPPVPGGDAVGLRAGLPVLLRPRMLAGLGVTVLTFTGFVAAFTYSAPMLRDVTGLGPGWLSAALVLYGLGTVAGTTLAGRVAPDRIGAVLPIAVLGLGAVLLLQGPALHRPLWAVVSLVGLGLSAFALAPLLQTWLMAQAGPAAAALAAAVNISVFGLAGALGAGLGGLLLGQGTGLDRLGAVAAVPVLAAALLAVGVARTRPGPTPRPAGIDPRPERAG